MGKLGSHSEFGTLREVVVGTAHELRLPPFGKDLSHYNPELRAALLANGDRPLEVARAFPAKHNETVRQIEGIASLLEAHGVKVHRPRPFNDQEAAYLDNLQMGRSQLYPADPVFVIGNHYLELSIRRAYRRKEIFPLREIVWPMIEDDSDAKFAAMPQSAPWLPSGNGPGPFLEGGDIMVLGSDILVGVGELCSSREGVEWLRRYIGNWGYRVHPVPIRGRILHALGFMCLLRNGLFMAHLPALAEGVPKPLKDWDVIEITEAEMNGHATVGLSLDDRRYLIDKSHERVIDRLVDHGIEPVTVETDSVGYWGGSTRCITLPLARDPA